MLVGKSRRRVGFTLVELLVVIGVIAVLIGMLLPALSKAQQQAKWLKCQANLRTIGQYLQMYSNQWRGACYPPGLGAGTIPPDNCWPKYVFGVWNPPVMLCPNDSPLNPLIFSGNAVVFAGEPQWDHSYILNDHIAEHGLKFGKRMPNNASPSEIVLMGEKTTSEPDYYMNEVAGNKSDFDAGKVELYRHGLRLGSNYLYMDLHVGPFKFRNATQMKQNVDPWEVDFAATQPSG
jgi:prepilin-type processing-associated H-X9-DG protein